MSRHFVYVGGSFSRYFDILNFVRKCCSIEFQLVLSLCESLLTLASQAVIHAEKFEMENGKCLKNEFVKSFGELRKKNT